MGPLTYKKAGVDIERAAAFKGAIKAMVRRSFRPEVLKDIGGFGSFFAFDHKRFRHPVLVSSADGVGTKLKVAFCADRHDTVGIDVVGMNVNDILCTGAEPLFFLDYIACGRLKPSVLTYVVRGIIEGCVRSGCSLIGGETAEMPGMYAAGEYDLAGFCVGVVERRSIIDGSTIRPGDVAIGLASSGLHSNGFSLVRKVFREKELLHMSAELLIPTRIYVKPVLALLRQCNRRRQFIRGIAHITGGAFYDKIARILPPRVDCRIDKQSWKAPDLFKLIQNRAGLPDRQMYATLNMGVGLVLITEPSISADCVSFLAEQGVESWVIGKIKTGKGKVEIV